MAKLVITMDLDNDALVDPEDQRGVIDGATVADVLRVLAGRLELAGVAEADRGPMLDGNGNTVGNWVVTP